MELPGIAFEIKDPQRDVRFRVLAYRELTRQEALRQIALHLQSRKRPPKRGSTVSILTTIGGTG